MKRSALKKALEKKGVYVVGDTEEFNGSKGGIWCSAERGEAFNYYAFEFDPKEEQYTCGVKNDIEKFVKKHGWFFEWNDCGTIMAWEV
jgi:hypothetical protein